RRLGSDLLGDDPWDRRAGVLDIGDFAGLLDDSLSVLVHAGARLYDRLSLSDLAGETHPGVLLRALLLLGCGVRLHPALLGLLPTPAFGLPLCSRLRHPDLRSSASPYAGCGRRT